MAELTIDWWQRRLNSLYIAFTSASTVVMFEGRREEYRSLDEIWRMIGFARGMIAELTPGAVLPTAPKSTMTYMDDYA